MHNVPNVFLHMKLINEENFAAVLQGLFSPRVNASLVRIQTVKIVDKMGDYAHLVYTLLS